MHALLLTGSYTIPNKKWTDHYRRKIKGKVLFVNKLLAMSSECSVHSEEDGQYQVLAPILAGHGCASTGGLEYHGWSNSLNFCWSSSLNWGINQVRCDRRGQPVRPKMKLRLCSWAMHLARTWLKVNPFYLMQKSSKSTQTHFFFSYRVLFTLLREQSASSGLVRSSTFHTTHFGLVWILRHTPTVWSLHASPAQGNVSWVNSEARVT